MYRSLYLHLPALILLGSSAQLSEWQRVDWRKVTVEQVETLLMRTPPAAWKHIALSSLNDPCRHFPPATTSAISLAACYSSRPEVVQVLLNGGARADDTGPDSPLLFAAQFNPEPRIIRVLLAHGADARAPLGFPILARPALTYAAQSNSSKAVIDELVASGASVNAKVSVLDNMGFTPLMYAAQYNRNPEITKELIRKGAKTEIAEAMGRTPLVLAAQYNGNPKVLTALITSGANVNLVCRDYSNIGWTPLMYAAASEANPMPKVALLLAAGADARAKSQDGRTALDQANANAMVSHSDPAYCTLVKASR